ncbi:MAG: phenylalanine 4-monooxygenase [Bacteroidota bacterium]|nr:phenylalanine 4-monooxygenase [Bacteroidota bacterium]MDP3144071.1 phenylalanine 4-monooxygenase [Bacteroidota bacterium]MDP3558207.1 phenylalanine 4-monooxygenase [Bacteroidota bacterium]
MRPTKQIYANYTPEDFLVWKTLFSRQLKNLENKVSNEFIYSLEKVGFNADSIPDFIKVNEKLNNYTGWQLVTVPNISEVNEFFIYLSQKKFTSTCWLRTLKQLDYLEEPDMFHDVFGHTPLLSNKNYSLFFEAMGKLAVKHIHQKEIILKLQRLYWFTIEFGLINENNKIKVFGAGIISSKEEAEHAVGNKSKKTEFNLIKIMKHDFRTDILQNEYYVIDSFEQLSYSLKQFETELEEGCLIK